MQNNIAWHSDTGVGISGHNVCIEIEHWDICLVDYLVFFKTYRTIGLRVRNNPLTNIPKGFGSEITLEVAEGRLQVAGLCMLKTHAFA